MLYLVIGIVLLSFLGSPCHYRRRFWFSPFMGFWYRYPPMGRHMHDHSRFGPFGPGSMGHHGPGFGRGPMDGHRRF